MESLFRGKFLWNLKVFSIINKLNLLNGIELFERQQEIGQLRALCRALQLEMRRSLATQQLLLQEKAAMEQESSELQDFLQNEKVAQCDALRELETEYQAAKTQLANREEEAKVLRDECRHLVRLNEQRRQENRLLQTKYAALENKSRELIHQQNAAVAGASTALSGLYARLDSLVEQLVCSYSISEQDLEVIFPLNIFVHKLIPTKSNAIQEFKPEKIMCMNKKMSDLLILDGLFRKRRHSYFAFLFKKQFSTLTFNLS